MKQINKKIILKDKPEEVKQVRVIKANCWNTEVGFVYNVKEFDNDYYEVIQPYLSRLFILKTDCEEM